jgi:DamX protein
VPAAAVPVEKVAPAKPAQALTLKAEKPAQASQPQATLPARDQRLLGMKGTDFMLQVLGSSNEQAVRDYVKRYVGQLPISYFETSMRDKPWFVVLVGPYASRELAQSAVLEFPADMQKQSPWVRTVASIQADIKARTRR